MTCPEEWYRGGHHCNLSLPCHLSVLFVCCLLCLPTLFSIYENKYRKACLMKQGWVEILVLLSMDDENAKTFVCLTKQALVYYTVIIKLIHPMYFTHFYSVNIMIGQTFLYGSVETHPIQFKRTNLPGSMDIKRPNMLNRFSTFCRRNFLLRELADTDMIVVDYFFTFLFLMRLMWYTGNNNIVLNFPTFSCFRFSLCQNFAILNWLCHMTMTMTLLLHHVQRVADDADPCRSNAVPLLWTTFTLLN